MKPELTTKAITEIIFPCFRRRNGKTARAKRRMFYVFLNGKILLWFPIISVHLVPKAEGEEERSLPNGEIGHLLIRKRDSRLDLMRIEEFPSRRFHREFSQLPTVVGVSFALQPWPKEHSSIKSPHYFRQFFPLGEGKKYQKHFSSSSFSRSWT